MAEIDDWEDWEDDCILEVRTPKHSPRNMYENGAEKARHDSFGYRLMLEIRGSPGQVPGSDAVSNSLVVRGYQIHKHASQAYINGISRGEFENMNHPTTAINST